MFTIVLIVPAAICLIVVVVHEVVTWRRPGRTIRVNAPMDSSQNNRARITHETNIHDGSSFGGTPGNM